LADIIGRAMMLVPSCKKPKSISKIITEREHREARAGWATASYTDGTVELAT
jgi:hypothetical protein